MPIYEYRCLACGAEFDKFFRSLKQISAEIPCPDCQSLEVRRRVSTMAIHTGGKGGGESQVEDSTSSKPAVFGRKELNEAMEKKKRLLDSDD